MAVEDAGSLAWMGTFSWKVLVDVPIGIIGAFVGALLSFGDVLFLMRYPYLNPWTLSVLGAVLTREPF